MMHKYTLSIICALTSSLVVLPATAMTTKTTSNIKDLNKKDSDENTPLHLAAREEKTERLQNLLNLGADPKLVNLYGQIPLHVAAQFGRIENVIALVNASNIDQIDHSLNRPLHFAATNGYTSMVELLIQRKANIEVTEGKGRTPLFMAAANLHVDCVKALLRAGAKQVAWSFGETPLDIATGYLIEPDKDKVKTEAIIALLKEKVKT